MVYCCYDDTSAGRLLVPEFSTDMVYCYCDDTSTGRLLVPEFSTDMVYCYCDDTSAGRLLVPGDIICPVVSASALTWFTATVTIPLLVDY